MMRVPHGPLAPYPTDQPLIAWLCQQFAEFGDVFCASIYGDTAYVITSPEYVEHVLLKNWQNYTKGRAIKRIGLLLGKGLMVSEGDFWISQRRMIQPAFHRKAIGALADMISLTNRQLLAEWEWAAEEKRSVNVTRDVSRMVLEVVLRSIFGDDYASVAAPFSILSDQPERSLEFADAFRPLARIVIEKAASRREANHIAGDILGMMMEARDRASNRPMSDAQLAREIMTLVVAGHETTASVLNWTWYLLSQHPLVEAKLSDELRRRGANEVLRLDELPRSSYARQVIEEAMRLYPPGWLMTRKAIKEDQIGEYFVPAGTEIYISPYLIQRHPDLWEEPGRFNPDRFAPGNSMRRHALAALPFSAGPRNCVGEFLARIEMQIHLMTVVPRMRLCYSSTGPPDLVAGVNLLSRHDFIMTPEIKTRRP